MPVRYVPVAPPFPYYGGKALLARRIVALMPGHKCYVEPYGGAASVLLAKSPSPVEVYNDLNGEVVNFFRVLRERLPELQVLLHFTPYARGEYVACLEDCDDPLEMARRTYVRQHMTYAAVQQQRGPRRWKASRTVSAGGMAKAVHAFRAGIVRLAAVAERFSRVQIECLPALEVIKRYDGPDTLFYCDPPYPTGARVASGARAYTLEMTDDDHRELADVLRAVRGKVLLSGYRCPLYDGLYRDWWRVELPTVAWAGRRTCGAGRTGRVEVVWANFPIGGARGGEGEEAERQEEGR
jgi:DNA adenine methylase